MSTIEFACTSCGKNMKTGAANAGKKGKCPKCGAVLDIPAAAQDPFMPPSSPPMKPASGTKPGTATPGESPMMPPSSASPTRPPPRPKGNDDLFGGTAGSAPAGGHQGAPDAGGAAAAGTSGDLFGGQPAATSPPASTGQNSQNLFGGVDSSAGAYGAQPGYSQPGYSQPGYSQPGYTPGYNAAPSYGPAGGNPYMSPAVNPYSEAAGPVYGGYALPAAAQGSADGMGISSMILGIVGLVLTLVSFCLSCAYIGVIGYPISLIVSIVGVILGHMARPSGMRVAGLVMNYINLAIYAAMILIVVIMLIFFGGIAALTPR